MGRVKKERRPQELTGVGIGDFIGLIGVQPDLLFATAKDTGGKPLLKPEHTVTNRKHYQSWKPYLGKAESPTKPAQPT